jgi:hypothetical protein
MRMSFSALKALLRRDTRGRYAGQRFLGRYNFFGTKFAYSALSVGALVLLEKEDGGYEVIMSQRSEKMRVHGGRWGFFGGFLEVKLSEGHLEAVCREIFQESSGAIVLDDSEPFMVVPPFMSYTGIYNPANSTTIFAFLLQGDKANEVRAAVREVIALGKFDHETKNIEIVPIDDRLEENIRQKGGLVFVQEIRGLHLVLEKLEERDRLLPPPKFRGVAANAGMSFGM